MPMDTRWRVPVAVAVSLLLINAGVAGSGVANSMSALRRTISAAAIQPVAWWPLEDGSDSSTFSSGLPGGRPLGRSGSYVIGGQSGPAGASGAVITSVVSGVYNYLKGDFNPISSSEFAVDFRILIPDPNAYLPGINVSFGNAATGPNERLFIYIDDVTVLVRALTSATTASVSRNIQDGEWHDIRATFVQNGADVDVELFLDGESVATDTSAGVTLSTIDRLDRAGPVAGGDGVEIFFSHLVIYDDISAPSLYDAGIGYAGETATTRFARLCTEAGVASDVAS